MSVSLIIPTRNQHGILDRAIKSISQSDIRLIEDLEIIVINNQSDDAESQQYLANLPQLAKSWGIDHLSIMDFDHAFNFSSMNNAAVERSVGDVLCFLNNDVEVITADWLQQLISEATKAHVGCAGALLYYPNDTVQHAGVILGMGTIAGHAYVGLPRASVNNHPYFQHKRLCKAVTGACLAIQRALFDSIGGFDDALAVAFNDIDLCLKISQAGFDNVFLPGVELYHHESLSRGKGVKTPEAKKRHRQEIQFMRDRWGHQVLRDPYWLADKSSDTIIDGAHTQSVKRRWRRTYTLAYQHKDLTNGR